MNVSKLRKGVDGYGNAGTDAGECTPKAELLAAGQWLMRGELRRGISLNKKYLNRKVRYGSKQALKRGDYKRMCKTLHMVEFS
jgi:hypothetical protein